MADKVVVVRLRAAVGEYTSGMARAGGQAVTFAGQLGVAGKAQGASMAASQRRMAQLGTAAAVAGKLVLAGIGGAMVVSAKAAIDFESSLAGVAKTVDGTDAQIRAIGESMRSLSTDIPVNVNALNNIAELGGQLGVEIPNLVEFTEVIAALGVTTNLSTEDAAKGLARLANVTGRSQLDFDVLGSVIVDLGNNFATTEAEILTFGLRIAPAAQTVGATAEEVLGLAAALSSMGIPAERGGTAVQQMLTIIASGARGGGAPLQVMADVAGVTADEFQNMALNAPVDTLVLLATALGEANENGENVFAMMKAIGINGKRAQAVLLAMSNNTGLLTDALETANVAAEENTALFEEAERRYGTTASQIQIMGNAFTDLRIELGQALLEPLVTVVKTMAVLFGMLKDNAGTIQDLVGWVGRLGIVFLGLGIANIAAKVLLLGKNFILAAQGVRALAGSAALLQAMSGPIGLIALAIGAIVTFFGAQFISATIDAAQEIVNLQAAADNFRASWEQSGDPGAALRDAFDPRRILDAAEGFRLAGGGINDLFDAAATGGPGLIGLLEDLKVAQAGAIGSDGDLGIGDDPFEGYEEGIVTAEAIGRSIALVEDAMDVLGTDAASQVDILTLAFARADTEGTRSLDSIEDAARTFLGVNPFGSESDFIAWLNESEFMGPTATAAGIDEVTDAAERGILTWTEYLNKAGPEGVEKQAKFFEGVGDLASEFADSLADTFDEIRTTITDSFPTWDDYGDSAEINFDKVLAAQEAWLADMQRWVPAQEFLLGQVSSATIAFLDEWGPVEKGALGRMFAKDPMELLAFAQGIETNLAAGAQAAEDVLVTRIPGIIEDATLAIPAKIEALVAELGLPRGDAEILVGAYNDGLASFIATLPEVFGPDMAAAIIALLTPSSVDGTEAHAAGFWLGNQWVTGLEAAFLGASVSLPTVIKEAVTDPIINTWGEQMTQSSPSKVAMELGEGFIEGLSMGLGSGIDPNIFQRVVPSLQATLNATIPNTTTGQVDGERTVQVFVEDAGGSVADQVQLGLLKAGVTEKIEWAGNRRI